MSGKSAIEFGRPEEREHFVGAHGRFFERLPNLQKALDAAFIRAGAPFNKPDLVIGALGKLCVDDFSELLLLCANGFGGGALKILRGMYERLVTARYLHLNPGMADAFWDYHVVKLSKLDLDDIVRKLDPEGEVTKSFKVAKAGGGRARLKNSWADLDFVRMAEEVGLGEHVQKAYRLPLEFAHPSVTAILQLLEFEGGSLTIKDLEPQRDMAEIAFPVAHFFILEVLRVQVEHFDLEDPVFQRCVDDYAYVWAPERTAPET